MKIAIVNNSNNPDMVQYFRAKQNIKKIYGLIFCSNSYSKNRFDRFCSSFSKNNTFSVWSFIDVFISFVLAIRLRFNSVRWIIFDTAHIANIPLAIFSKILGIRLSFTIHDWIPHEGKMSGCTKFYNKCVRSFLADHLILFSPVETKYSHSVLKLSGFEAQNLSVTRDGSQFLFFGRIEPYKGLRHIVGIAELLATRMPNAKILIMGSGNDPNLELIKGCPNVELKNHFIPEDELNIEIARSASVILPYDSATQSGVICKSFSCGTPVVAFDVGSIGSYLEHQKSGFLVNHGDISGFVDSMICASKECSVMSSYIKSGFDQKYGSEALISQYQQLIQDLLLQNYGQQEYE